MKNKQRYRYHIFFPAGTVISSYSVRHLSRAPMFIIYKHNFVDLGLIMAFSVSTVIITEYSNRMI